MSASYHLQVDDTPCYRPHGSGNARLILQTNDGGQSQYMTVCYFESRAEASAIAEALNQSIHLPLIAKMIKRIAWLYYEPKEGE